jgi:predicted transcriptional regulator
MGEGLAMEKLSNLLFELANVDRLKILLEIQGKPQRLTQISEELELTVQETSRYLARLSEAKLIIKDAGGLYNLVPYGEYVIKQLSGLDFLSYHREYFAAHDLSSLPDEYIARLGELKGCSFTDDVMVAFSKAENLIAQAQEYVWIIGNQVLMSTLPILEAAVKRGAQFRLILPENLTPPPGFKPLPTIPNRVERRTLKHVDVIMTVSEKEARVGFLGANGKLDPSAFESKDAQAHKYCRDLYLHHWEKAKTGRPHGYPVP